MDSRYPSIEMLAERAKQPMPGDAFLMLTWHAIQRKFEKFNFGLITYVTSKGPRNKPLCLVNPTTRLSA